MTDWTRFAVFVAPSPGPFADFTARWLGWDPAEGTERPHPDLPGLPRPAEEVTETPRKYGFHGTIRAPFRPAEGLDLPAIDAQLEEMARRIPPAEIPALRMGRLGRFLALVPHGDSTPLDEMAAAVVRETNALRAPLTKEEIARRNPDQLDETRRALLDAWGYPHVMEAFRFHMTLTGPLHREELFSVETALAPALMPAVPRPFRVDHLCLFGEASDGRFHLLHRYALAG
ncbi:Protein of unknown function [Tranquillimonas rosea]|uniref:Phosphonate metabolism protein n=1 Tax=Tranquillimonas rosea TaxID=641238 RepID=A0A1H9WRC5_9RHOB|nr:DUF1045 domain-containing protein [Tranquillimonas rosea]SES36227.1 Protein of unknown function [Tranquillimonas rosea]